MSQVTLLSNLSFKYWTWSCKEPYVPQVSFAGCLEDPGDSGLEFPVLRIFFSYSTWPKASNETLKFKIKGHLKYILKKSKKAHSTHQLSFLSALFLSYIMGTRACQLVTTLWSRKPLELLFGLTPLYPSIRAPSLLLQFWTMSLFLAAQPLLT